MENDSSRVRKDAAVDFLQLVVAGRIEEAYRKYVEMDGTHHNPHTPAGFQALKEGMVASHSRFPDKRITVVNVLGDNDRVAVHSRLVLRPGEGEVAVVHLFRFRGFRIVEMWDVAQQVPVDSPNDAGAF